MWITLTILLNISILTEHPLLEQANIGVEVRNLKTGELVESYRADKVIPPASVMKLLTTGCALGILGPDFRFETTIERTGPVENGILHGDLVIRGGCDPSLGSRQMKRANFLSTWVNAIRDAGISRINGRVVADMSLLDGDATNPGWLFEDMGNYYAPGIFALNYLDNTTNIVLQSGNIGTVATVLRSDPEIPGLRYINHIRCTNITYDGAYVHGLAYSNERYLTGSVPSSQGTFGVKGDIPNPGLLLATHLTNALRNAGISVKEEPDYITESSLYSATNATIYVHRSESLAELVRETNIHSNNLFAESIFRYLGTRYAKPGTIQQSADVVREYWAQRGIQIRGARIMDGCGLAPQDAVSAETWVQILRYMAKSPNAETWFASLPISGETGTLRGLGAGTELAGKIQAKSGTIGGTKNFAGYIETKSGDRLVFAVLVNSAACKAKKIQGVIQKYLTDIYQNN